MNEIESQEANNRPVGSHKPTYTELLTLAKQFVDECKNAKGKPDNMGVRLDSMAKVAEKLPGQAQLDREDPKPKTKPRDLYRIVLIAFCSRPLRGRSYFSSVAPASQRPATEENRARIGSARKM